MPVLQEPDPDRSCFFGRRLPDTLPLRGPPFAVFREENGVSSKFYIPNMEKRRAEWYDKVIMAAKEHKYEHLHQF